jgi:Pretoxin HINT domain
MRRLLCDRRGAAYLETLIAFVPVFVFFLATLQLADASVAQLVVDHASAAAARAAVVVLPDDGQFYDDREQAHLDQFTEVRRGDVERAADLILRANPRLDASQMNVGLDRGRYAARDDVTATVTARYGCLLPGLCGGGFTMVGQSKLIYQGAHFTYDDTTLGKFHRKERHQSDGTSATGEPPKHHRRGDDDGESGPREDDGRKPPVATRPPHEGEPGAHPPRDQEPARTPLPRDSEGRPQLPIVAVRDPGGEWRDPDSCFVAGTGVSTPKGARAIEGIKPGDQVYSFDENQDRVVVATVARTFPRKVDHVFDLTILDVASNTRDVITGTGEHPFYLPERGHYQPLHALAPGMLLLTMEGVHAEVISLEMRRGSFDVYNFEVKGEHNYFVQGSTDPPRSVLVHNQCKPTRGQQLYPRPHYAHRPDRAALDRHFDELDKHERKYQNRVDLFDGFEEEDPDFDHEDWAHLTPEEQDARRKRQKGSNRGKITEAIGERAFTNWMLQNEPDFQLELGFRPGTGFDQVWVKRDASGMPVEIILGEAKGPGAELGDTKNKGRQMSQRWVDATLAEMARSSDSNERELADEIRWALANGQIPVRGVVIQADENGGMTQVPFSTGRGAPKQSSPRYK